MLSALGVGTEDEVLVEVLVEVEDVLELVLDEDQVEVLVDLWVVEVLDQVLVEVDVQTLDVVVCFLELVVVGSEPLPNDQEPYISPASKDANCWNKDGVKSNAPYGQVGH